MCFSFYQQQKTNLSLKKPNNQLETLRCMFNMSVSAMAARGELTSACRVLSVSGLVLGGGWLLRGVGGGGDVRDAYRHMSGACVDFLFINDPLP